MDVTYGTFVKPSSLGGRLAGGQDDPVNLGSVLEMIADPATNHPPVTGLQS